MFTTFSASSPQIFLAIDRTKARMLDVPIANIFEALQVNLGSSYVNDFNAFGRVYQVRAQADQTFRVERQDILRLKVRSATGRPGPARHSCRDPRRFRARSRFSATTCTRRFRCRATPRPAIRRPPRSIAMETLARQVLPQGTSYRVDGARLPGAPDRQSRRSSSSPLSVLFVFLVLAAQYESWSLPLAIVLIVPMSLLARCVGVVAARHGQQHPDADRFRSCWSVWRRRTPS